MRWMWAVILLVPSLAFAQPLLTCDPQAGVEKYKVIWTAGGESISDAGVDGSCLHDLAGVPDGDNAGEIRAGKEYILDGVGQGIYEWSDPTPFLYSNPADTTPPTGLGLGE